MRSRAVEPGSALGHAQEAAAQQSLSGRWGVGRDLRQVMDELQGPTANGPRCSREGRGEEAASQSLTDFSLHMYRKGKTIWEHKHASNRTSRILGDDRTGGEGLVDTTALGPTTMVAKEPQGGGPS